MLNGAAEQRLRVTAWESGFPLYQQPQNRPSGLLRQLVRHAPQLATHLRVEDGPPVRIRSVGQQLDCKRCDLADATPGQVVVGVEQLCVAAACRLQADAETGGGGGGGNASAAEFPVAIRRIPLVPQSAWRRLCILAHQTHLDKQQLAEWDDEELEEEEEPYAEFDHTDARPAATRSSANTLGALQTTTRNALGTFLEQLCGAACQLPHTVLPLDVEQYLSDPRNAPVVLEWEHVRETLHSPHNPVYRYAACCYLLGLLTLHGITPSFCPVFEMGRARDAELCNPATDAYCTPLPVEVIVVERPTSYYTGVLGTHAAIDAEMLLAHLFQVVFALDAANTIFGYSDGGHLDVAENVGFVPCRWGEVTKNQHKNNPNNSYLHYSWRGDRYRVPTFGRVLKLQPSTTGAMLLSREDTFPDLRGLGTSLQKALRDRQLVDRSKREGGGNAGEAVRSLLRLWTSPSGKQPSPAEVTRVTRDSFSRFLSSPPSDTHEGLHIYTF